MLVVVVAMIILASRVVIGGLFLLECAARGPDVFDLGFCDAYASRSSSCILCVACVCSTESALSAR